MAWPWIAHRAAGPCAIPILAGVPLLSGGNLTSRPAAVKSWLLSSFIGWQMAAASSAPSRPWGGSLDWGRPPGMSCPPRSFHWIAIPSQVGGGRSRGSFLVRDRTAPLVDACDANRWGRQPGRILMPGGSTGTAPSWSLFGRAPEPFQYSTFRTPLVTRVLLLLLLQYTAASLLKIIQHNPNKKYSLHLKKKKCDPVVQMLSQKIL